MARVKPYVSLRIEGGGHVVRDDRTGDEFAVSGSQASVLDRLMSTSREAAGSGRWDVDELLSLALLVQLGAVVEDEPACERRSCFRAVEQAFLGAAECSVPPWLGLVGLPWDLALGSRGAALGPAWLRAASRAFMKPLPDRGRLEGWYSHATEGVVLAGATVRDFGDLDCPDIPEYPDVEEMLASALSELSAAGVRLPVLVGGEHALTLCALRAMGPLCPSLVHVDAHDDFDPSPDLNHGTFVAHAVREGLVESVHMVGLRGLIPPSRHTALEQAGVARLTTRRLKVASAQELDAFVESIPSRDVYLSVDVDVLDPSIVSATACPLTGGLALEDLHRFLACLARRRRIVAIDLMELGRPRAGFDISHFVAVELLLLACDAVLGSGDAFPR
jgi:arginase family enzyme